MSTILQRESENLETAVQLQNEELVNHIKAKKKEKKDKKKQKEEKEADGVNLEYEIYFLFIYT